MPAAHRTALVLPLLLWACANRSPQEPSGTEVWIADLQATNRSLFMSFAQPPPGFSGTGQLVPLTVPGGYEDLTLVGTRLADTLDITFSRANGGQFRFVGWYVSQGTAISGVLDGDEFTRLSVRFRKP